VFAGVRNDPLLARRIAQAAKKVLHSEWSVAAVHALKEYGRSS
jgi:hypothetical protein